MQSTEIWLLPKGWYITPSKRNWRFALHDTKFCWLLCQQTVLFVCAQLPLPQTSDVLREIACLGTIVADSLHSFVRSIYRIDYQTLFADQQIQVSITSVSHKLHCEG